MSDPGQTSAALTELLERIPAFAGRPREVTPLPGGLTNVNHKVVTDQGAFVLRRWSVDTGLLAIDRDHEHANSVRAAEVGVGAPVIDYLPEHNTMVFGFLKGRTMRAVDLDDPARLVLAAATCRRLHAARPFAGEFDMFELIERYRAIVAARGFRLPARFDAFAPQVAEARDALAARRPPSVSCHNDLLAENFLLHDGAFRLIDYEYAGNNDPCFELGNIWSEAGLSLHRLPVLVDAYFGRHLRHQVARARLWGLVAKYGWTLWASIQDGVSALDFDFWAWGMEKYDRAVVEFDDPGFAALLDEARRAD